MVKCILKHCKCIQRGDMAVASTISTLPEHQLCPLIESSPRPGDGSMTWGGGPNWGRGHSLGVGTIVMSVLHMKK